MITQTHLESEILKRRTFAIISHPDAGKTTLTEKLLLYSDVLNTAGMVAGRKGRKGAHSDWMSMERERGISITASAMQFHYKDKVINILDTPGHEDFSVDTYRTLTAADCAIMVIDAAKGVEKQTIKLFEACRLRKIPVMTFVNKMDMPGLEPIDLLNEVEKVLGILATPMNWPIGGGRDFKGVYDRRDQQLIVFEKTAAGGAKKALMHKVPRAELKNFLNSQECTQLEDDLELLEMAGNPFVLEDFLDAKLSPVFFGSALTNFGVEPFFDAFIELAPSPKPYEAIGADEKPIFIDPIDSPFSAYCFKLQANLDKHHRGVTAFFRIVSGLFEKDMLVLNHRLKSSSRISRPSQLSGSDQVTIESAVAGDIIGIASNGSFQINDTISTTKGGFRFKPLPQFQPEFFARIRPKEVSGRKSFDKGCEQLSNEGAILLLKEETSPDPIFAAVGRLQFEVLEWRLKDEYNVETTITPLSFQCSAWLIGDLKTFKKNTTAILAFDAEKRPIVLFQSTWEKEYAIKQNPNHKLVDILQT